MSPVITAAVRRRFLGRAFAMQERNWREVLKVNAQFAECHREALHHLDCIELAPSGDDTNWERLEAAKLALRASHFWGGAVAPERRTANDLFDEHVARSARLADLTRDAGSGSC